MKMVDINVILITKLNELWKIINVKRSFQGLRLNDSLRDGISSSTYLAELAVSMAASHRKCAKSLTKDKAIALEEHT